MTATDPREIDMLKATIKNTEEWLNDLRSRLTFLTLPPAPELTYEPTGEGHPDPDSQLQHDERFDTANQV